MKVGAVIAVNCDKENIWFCLKGIYDFCDVVVVVYSDTTWVGERREDGTLDVIRGFDDRFNKVVILEGTYVTQPDQRNAGLSVLREEKCDFVFVVDSDEIYDPQQLIEARRFLEQHSSNVFRVRWRMFWKTLQYELEFKRREIEVFYRITDDFYFKGPARQAGYNEPHKGIAIPHVDCYHLTCVCSDAQMKHKIQTRTYRDQVVPDWYEKKWLGWHLDMRDLHPTVPTVYKRAIPFDCKKWPNFMRGHRFYELAT